MNLIWFLLLVVGTVFAIINGKLDAFTQALFDGAKQAVEIFLFLIGIMALWLGITKIIEDSGLVNKLSKFFKPLLLKLFKNIPSDHPAIAHISLNMIANFFGLGNAATPLGLKAIKDLQELNPDKETVSFEMMLFLVINTASIQLIPFTLIGLLSQYGSQNPTAIVLPTILATFISAVVAVTVLHIFKYFYKERA